MIMKLKIISFVILLVFVVGFIFTFIINTSKSKLNDKSDFNSQQEIVIKDQVEQKKEATEEIKKKIVLFKNKNQLKVL